MFHVNQIYSALVHHKILFHAYTRIFPLKNQGLCQHKYGNLYHVIQLLVMTSDRKRMNKIVVNNVLKKEL